MWNCSYHRYEIITSMNVNYGKAIQSIDITTQQQGLLVQQVKIFSRRRIRMTRGHSLQ